MSKKIVFSVLVLAAAAAVVVPMLGCDEAKRVEKYNILFQQPDTLVIPPGSYYTQTFMVVDSMFRFEPYLAYLNVMLVCTSSSPDNHASFYIFTPSQFADYVRNVPNPPALKSAVDRSGCSLLYEATVPGTFYAVIDNTGDTLHEKRVTGVISIIWYVMEKVE